MTTGVKSGHDHKHVTVIIDVKLGLFPKNEHRLRMSENKMSRKTSVASKVV
jgi:hypothetical protein